MAHEGSFSGKGGKDYEYEVIDWMGRNDRERHGTGEDITDADLSTAAEVIVKVTEIDSGEVSYETIIGEFEDWDFVDRQLEFDYGSEGSRGD